MASSSKYQQLISTGQAEAEGQGQDSLSHSDLSINHPQDVQYHSIESYNINNHPRQHQLQSQSQSQSPTNLSTATAATTPPRNEYTRSSSPIPVLIRSASSLLSRSMRLPPGSLRASTFTVITGMVGGGTFTFSYGIYKCGMLPGLFYLLLIASLAGYTTHAIVYCAEKNNCPSFRQLAKKLYSNQLAIFIQIALVLLLWMACISYMTLTKNLLSSAMKNLFANDKWYDNDILLLLFASIIPTYLALQRKVSALRYASLFGLCVVIFSAILVVVTYINSCQHHITDCNDPAFHRKCTQKSLSDRNYWFNSDILGHTYTIALFFGGFAAQFTVLPIYFEMQKRSPRNMTKCIVSGFGITCTIYLVVAYVGYWSFPNLTDPKNDQNLITLYENDTAMLIVQILLALYVMSIIPLFAHAFRKSLNELIYSRLREKKKRKEKRKIQRVIDDELPSPSSSNGEGHREVDDRDIIEDAISNPHLAYVPISPEAKKIVEQNKELRGKKGELNEMELPTFYHALVTILFLGSVFGVAIFAQNIGQVNSIISSTTLPIVCFIFPAMCAVKTDTSLTMKCLTSLMALLSVLNAIMFFYNMFASL